MSEEELNKKKNDLVLLFSSCPLLTSNYEKDDRTIDSVELKDCLKLDILYLFNPEEIEKEEKINIKKYLILQDCNYISYEEKKQCIIL